MPAELLARLQRLTLALGEAHTHDDIARVVSAHGGDPGTEEHALVATLGEHTAKYLDARDRLESIVTAASALSKTLTRDDVANAVIEHGMRLARADTCTLYMLDASGALALIGERGTAPEVLERIRRVPRTRDSLLFDQINTSASRFVETASDYAKLFPGLSAIESNAPRAKAFWSVPLFVENRAMGLLGMGFYEERTFSRDERLFVEAFGQQCAQALLRAQHLGREAEARQNLATTLRSIGDAVIATDGAGRITFMNPVAEALTGWDEGEARDHPLDEVFRIVNEQTRATVESPVDRVLREGKVVGLANHTVLVGRRREVAITDSGAPIRDDAGNIRGVVLVFRDASQEKQDEALRVFLGDASTALASSLEVRATLARVAQLAVPTLADWCVIDLLDEGKTDLDNVAVANVDPKKIGLARELRRKFPPDPKAPTGVHQVARSGKSEFYPLITDDMISAGISDPEQRAGTLELQLRSVVIVPLSARGRALGAVTLCFTESSGRHHTKEDLAIAEDFAARAALAVDNARLFAAERHAHELAEQASRSKDAFLAAVSHELRTPLNAIFGWARMLKGGSVPVERQQHGIEVIERNSIAMTQLIEDLLDVARIVSGKLRVDTQPVDLAEITASAIESARPAAAARGVELQIAIEPVGNVVAGDPARLQQVVWNLLSNAVKFTPHGGHVRVSVALSEAHVDIVVADDGKGIDDAFITHVFEPFRQAEGALTRKHGGLGLGLAITKHLVELHGGTISVTSGGAALGSTFTVRLPTSAGRTSGAHAPTQSAIARPPALQGVRVLLVEDDDDARFLLAEVISASGAVPTSAASVAEAMDAIGRERFAVIISDISMPGESGFDLIRKVRALSEDAGGATPAIALTAYARREDRASVIAAGFAAHVAKPIEPNELIAVVESVIVTK